MRYDKQNNRILISYKEVVPTIWKKGAYDFAKNKGNIVTLGRPSPGREVEIVYDECKPSYQEKMRVALGDLEALLQARERKGEPVLSLNDLTNRELEVCNARWVLVNSYREYAECNKERVKGVVNAKRDFVDLVVSGMLCEEAYKVVGNLSFQTLERWDKMLRDGGDVMSALAPKRKEVKVAGGLTEEQKRLLVSLYCTPNQPTMADSLRMAERIWQAKGEGVPSRPRCLRFMTEWLKENEALAVFKRRGMKALKDGYLPYLERDPESIRFMDVLVSDGHVMNFQVDYTVAGADGREVHKVGRPTMLAWQDMKTGMVMGFELMMTENTLSVASSFRLACMNAASFCGCTGSAILPRVVYMDNGKAYKNKFFNAEVDLKNSVGGLFEQLKGHGLECVQYALPYNARSKVIERSWRNFLEVEKQALSYTGDSIENKPARMMRNEVLHREAYAEELNKRGMLTLQGAYRMLDRWIKEYNCRVSDGKYLNGRSPADAAQEQVPEINFSGRMLAASDLNYMIMQRRVCCIERNGVRINGNWYYNAKEFVLLPKGEVDVVVKYDVLHPEKVYVFRTNGEFWCEAGFYCGNRVHAMAVLGSDADRQGFRAAIRENKRIEHAVTVMARAVGGDGTELGMLVGECDVLPDGCRRLLPAGGDDDLDDIRMF